MTTDRHVAGDLGVYLAGAMERQEGWALESHLAVCGWCTNELRELREVTTLLEGMPPEVLLDGPPDGSDLLLKRTVRQIRREESRRGRRVLGVAAALVLGVAGLGGGYVYGQQSAPVTVPVAAPQPAPVQEPAATPPGATTARAVDKETGAEAEITLLPAAGWVRLTASVDNIPPGERCRMVVVAEDGTREVAFNWLTGDPAMNGVPLSGSALVAPEDVKSVDVENEDGKTFVSVAV